MGKDKEAEKFSMSFYFLISNCQTKGDKEMHNR